MQFPNGPDVSETIQSRYTRMQPISTHPSPVGSNARQKDCLNLLGDVLLVNKAANHLSKRIIEHAIRAGNKLWIHQRPALTLFPNPFMNRS